MTNDKNTLGHIMRQNGIKYRLQHKLPLNQLKTMRAIEDCRTEAMGGHMLECTECGKKHIWYNSCRNRHCPQCQGDTKQKWVERRQAETLPVPYYHIIFTVPSELNPVMQQNQEIMYKILFQSASETLLELAAERKYLGARIGFMSVLHTWGQNLKEHPHVHTLIPGGGIGGHGDYWLDVSHRKYFMPVHVISQVFRGKFLYLFEKYHREKQIGYYGDQLTLEDPKQFNLFKNRLYSKGWIVHIRPPFATAQIVIEYLSRYLNRVALSNSRIIAVDSENVSFRWTDNRDGKEKVMKLSIMEFIRRFLLHVLPGRFVKIRYYGFLSNRNRRANVEKCYRLITFKKLTELNRAKERKTGDNTAELQIEIYICPICKGIMKKSIIPRIRHGPNMN